MILVKVTKKDNGIDSIFFNPEEVKTIEGINSNLHAKVTLKDGREIETWESLNVVMQKMKKAMVVTNKEEK